MVEIVETNTDGLKHEYKVTIPAGEVEQRMTSRLEELKKEARLPGFRPGKVPLNYLRQRFGQAVRGEILEQAVNEGSQQALNEKEIRPAQQPKIELTSSDEDGDVEFTMSVERLPEIEPTDFSGLSLERLKVEIPDEMLQEQLQALAKRNRDTEEVTEDRGAETGDIVAMDFHGEVDGVQRDDMHAHDYEVELGSSSLVGTFEDQLIGAKPGEHRDVEVTFPDDYSAEDLRGKTAKFHVDVKALKVPKEQPVDDSLAEKLAFDSLDELKDTLRQQIQQEYDNAARSIVKRKLLDELSEQHDFPLPQGLVDGEFDGIWHRLEHDREQGNLSEEDQNKSEDELREEYRRIAERRVRLGLLLAEIGRRNNIEITQDELNRAVVQEARRHPGQEAAVFQYFQQNPQAMEQLRAPVYEDKVVDFILEMADVRERTVSPEEFRQEQERLSEADSP